MTIYRELEIENGVVTIERENNLSYFFADCNNGMICCKWSGKSLCGELLFERENDENAEYYYEINNNLIIFSCYFGDGNTYKVYISYLTDGITHNTNYGIKFENATYLTTFVDIEIDGNEKAVLNKQNTPFDDYLKIHKEKFSALMNRSSFELTAESCKEKLPTNLRVRNLKDGKWDNGLYSLYFDYGRYLLLSCCICAELPANLQGKWNIDLNPPWQCDYHTDINLEMNYWMTEALGMHECSRTLFNYIKKLIPAGKEAAKKLYGCKGVWFPLQGDCNFRATPEAYGYAAWIGAAAWLAQHLWKHWIYTNDIEFLKSEAYPLFKEVAEFYEDYLVKDENGIYQIMPSQSPENKFDETGEFPVSICTSSAMDIELAVDALFYAIEASDILKTDVEQAKIWKALKNNLPKLQIGSDGRLLEWNKEFKETEPGHRHVSHLYGLYPSDLINEYESVDLYCAALKSLEVRMSTEGWHTGWSRAWVSNIYAKSGNKEMFFEHYRNLITDFSTDSLLDLHPPGIFQIDGNLGAVSAVLEALVSVSGGKIRLLNALPVEWIEGRVCGVFIPGGHRLSLEWKNGKLYELKIEFGFGNEIVFIINGNELKVLKDGLNKTIFFKGEQQN